MEKASRREEAVACINSCSRKAPKLENTAFAVFSPRRHLLCNFRQSGKEFRQQPAELAVNVCSTVDADVEYQAAASEWRARVVDVLKSRAPVAAPSQSVATGAVNDIHTSPYTKRRAADRDPP